MPSLEHNPVAGLVSVTGILSHFTTVNFLESGIVFSFDLKDARACIATNTGV
jgi:hypothetical protein